MSPLWGKFSGRFWRVCVRLWVTVTVSAGARGRGRLLGEGGVHLAVQGYGRGS